LRASQNLWNGGSAAPSCTLLAETSAASSPHDARVYAPSREAMRIDGPRMLGAAPLESSCPPPTHDGDVSTCAERLGRTDASVTSQQCCLEKQEQAELEIPSTCAGETICTTRKQASGVPRTGLPVLLYSTASDATPPHSDHTATCIQIKLIL
jgi:hypothetical protein